MFRDFVAADVRRLKSNPECQSLVTSAATQSLFLKQRLRELFGIKGLQIVRLFAEADELDLDTEAGERVRF